MVDIKKGDSFCGSELQIYQEFIICRDAPEKIILRGSKRSQENSNFSAVGGRWITLLGGRRHRKIDSKLTYLLTSFCQFL